MTTLYKLTDQQMQTHGGFQWALNEPRTALGTGPLCSAGWLHAYTSPRLAVLFNPIHADIQSPRLFRAEGVVDATDHGLKVGCTGLVLVEELPLPVITTAQHVSFGILCAKQVCTDPLWNAWADGWLAGHDRSEAAAKAAWAVAWEAGWAPSEAAAAASWATSVERAVAQAAWAAREAAWAAREAAEEAEKRLDLDAIARQAMEIK